MKSKLKAMTTALALAGALSAVSVPAHAFIYAQAGVSITDVAIGIGTVNPITGGFTLANARINSFTLSAQDSANLNNTGNVGFSAACSIGTCSTTSPVLDISAANGLGGSLNRANNDFTIFGPTNAGSYSNSDAIVRAAQIITGTPDNLQIIAESNLAPGGSSALANSTITSDTGFSLQFTASGINAFQISFNASAQATAIFIDALNPSGNAQAVITTSLLLTNDTTGASASWRPNGTAGGCFAGGGFVCTSVVSGTNLNRASNASSNGTSNPFSGSGPFFLQIAGLTDGNYTLSLATQARTVVSRVPEPASLALMGAGLAGLGFFARKRKQA